MKIKLSKDIQIDLDRLIESRLLVQANSGGGKSYTLRRFIEQTFGKKQIIIIDPEGEFGNLRTKYDFVYIGQGGDAPAEPRSAALLARRLMETKANAIIDIYELGSKRSEFVKYFMDAMVNMPKELWTDCFIILDEAHKFAPEKGQGESIALSSVIDMASLGRKRGYCLVPATQRPSKLSKDVVAECNNKLIGRASLDIDRKRSAEELGFHTKEEILSLRNLQPGEFYVFGPAISNEVVKTTIGDVLVKPPKRGTGRSIKIAPPTAKVKAILAKLADLPQEAEKELRTVAELKSEIVRLKQHTCPNVATPDPKATKLMVDSIIAARDNEWKNKLIDANAEIKRLATVIEYAADVLEVEPPVYVVLDDFKIQDIDIAHGIVKQSLNTLVYKPHFEKELQNQLGPIRKTTVGKGELAVLNAIAQYEEGISMEHLAVLTGYKQTSRRVYTQRLAQMDLIHKNGEHFVITQEGKNELGDLYKPLPTGRALLEHLMQTLPDGEKRVLSAILNEDGVSREYIEHETGYKTTSVRVYIQRLAARKAVETRDGLVYVTDKLR